MFTQGEYCCTLASGTNTNAAHADQILRQDQTVGGIKNIQIILGGLNITNIGLRQFYDPVAAVGQHCRSANGFGGRADPQGRDIQAGTDSLGDVAGDQTNGVGVVAQLQAAIGRDDAGQLQIAGAANGDRRIRIVERRHRTV